MQVEKKTIDSLKYFVMNSPVNAGLQYNALIDDHVLLRNGLRNLIGEFGRYNILFEADNGEQLIAKLDPAKLPDVVLLDINMPKMNGYETAEWLRQHCPGTKILALSMYDNEASIIRMFKAGASGYILKDSDPQELKTALHHIITKGYYYSEMVTGNLIHSINKMNDRGDNFKLGLYLNENELTFLKLTCTEMTYKEIADKMFLSPRTIDGYRDNLFQKLQIKTRVGLVLYAIRNRIVAV